MDGEEEDRRNEGERQNYQTSCLDLEVPGTANGDSSAEDWPR